MLRKKYIEKPKGRQIKRSERNNRTNEENKFEIV